MADPATAPKRKIEIVAEAPVMRRLTDMVSRAGATGYTLLPAILGHGRAGDLTSSPLSEAEAAQMLLVVADASLAAEIVTEAHRLLTDFPHMILVSDVAVVRGDDY